MNKDKTFKNAIAYGNAHAVDFLKPAQYKIANEIRPILGEPPFTETSIRGFEDAFGADMATGSILTRKKYITIGLVIGATLVSVGSALYNKYKEKRVKKIYTLERN
jgi:hypothetical protein